MGMFGNAVAWVRGRFESEQAALDREAGERYDAHPVSDGVRGPSTAGPGLIGAAEIGRARTVEHTDWQDVAGSGEVRHAILRDDAGFYVRLEDDLLGPRNYALGPFPSLDFARDEARRSVEAKAVAVEAGVRAPDLEPVVEAPMHGSRVVVEETPWQALGGDGAASIRHVITCDNKGYYVQREDNDEWSPQPPVGPFRALRDALYEAEMDFEDLRTSFASYEARMREPEVAPWWDIEPHRDLYIPTAHEEAEIGAWKQAERDRADERESSKDRVEAVHTSEWTTTSPAHEERTHIGRSEEGWHYAIEASRDGGDRYEDGLPWSPARPSREEAETALDDAQHARFMRDTASHDRDDEEHGL